MILDSFPPRWVMTAIRWTFWFLWMSPWCRVIVRVRLVGAIEAEQKEKGDKWTRNDRLIAVATHAQTHNGATTLSDLRPHLVKEIKEFFATYNKLRDRKFKPKQETSPGKARKLVKDGTLAFKKRQRSKAR
jgi:inorganic pyrophosphatase